MYYNFAQQYALALIGVLARFLGMLRLSITSTSPVFLLQNKILYVKWDVKFYSVSVNRKKRKLQQTKQVKFFR